MPIKKVYVCTKCGRRFKHEGKKPERCPHCGGPVVEKVVVE